MNFLRLILLPMLLALLLMGRADAGPPCGPGGGMMGGPPPGMSGPPPGMGGPGGGMMGGPPPGMSGPPPGMGGPGGGMMGGPSSGSPAGAVNFGMCGPPAGGAAAGTGQVINHLNNYLKNQPNLKAGKLTVKGDYWEAEILDSQGNLVNKLRVDPRNGYFYYQK